MKLKTLVTAQTHTALLALMGQESLLRTRGPSDWLNGCWELCSSKYEVCVDAVFDAKNKPSPLFKLSEHGSDVQFILFRGNMPPANFDLPIPNAATQWAVGVFTIDTDEFVGGLLVGSFADALAAWCKPNKHKLDIAFAEFVASLDPKALTKIKSNLQKQMLDELDALEREHTARVAATRGRYRNRLNYFTTLHDDAQDRLDKKDKATYTIELDGYPPSRAYGSYKEARRAHSKRNAPHIAAVIKRHHKKETSTFAKWSIYDRVWNIL